MKKVNLLAIGLFVCVSLFGQKEHVIMNKTYSNAHIVKRNNKVIKVSSVQMVNDTLLKFKAIGADKGEELLIKKAKYVEIKYGNKALPFGLYGAGVGVLGVLLAVREVESNSNVVYRDNLGLRIGLIIGGSGAIGALIGALTPKWKRLYFPKKTSTSSFSMIFYPKVANKYYCLGLIVNF